MKYVRTYRDTTRGYQPATRSVSTASLIGTSEDGPTGKFLLTKPSGDNFDTLTENSNLYNGIVSFYQQRNPRELWCVRLDSDNTSNITGEVLSPRPNGSRTQFQLSLANITTLSELRVNDTAYTLAAGSPGEGEYTVSLTAGTVTLGDAPSTGDIVDADYSIDALNSAFMSLRNEDIALMALAGDYPLTTYMKLVDEVVKASADGQYRLAIMQLPTGQPLDRTFDSEGYRYSNWPDYLESERAILVAHKNPADANEDAAAAVMGEIASEKVESSLTAKPVSITQYEYFTASEVYSMNQRNIVVLDRFPNSTQKIIARGKTLSADSSIEYIDKIRVLDDIAYTVEAFVNSPLVIGRLKYNTPGLTGLANVIRGSLGYKIRIGEIEGIEELTIPALSLSQLKDSGSLTADEEIEFRAMIESRTVGNVRVVIDYRGAIEDVDIYLIA